jgi:hypothetical protein
LSGLKQAVCHTYGEVIDMTFQAWCPWQISTKIEFMKAEQNRSLLTVQGIKETLDYDRDRKMGFSNSTLGNGWVRRWATRVRRAPQGWNQT